jgi:hypothetical protein
VELIIQLIAGALGGNAAGAVLMVIAGFVKKAMAKG